MGNSTDTNEYPVTQTHIVSTPGVCGGKPRIANTRIRVQDIYVWHELHGRTPEQIVVDFPQLSLADVYAALTFYFDNRELIHRDMKEAEDLVAKMKAKNGAGLLDRLPTEIKGGPVSSG